MKVEHNPTTFDGSPPPGCTSSLACPTAIPPIPRLDVPQKGARVSPQVSLLFLLAAFGGSSVACRQNLPCTRNPLVKSSAAEVFGRPFPRWLPRFPVELTGADASAFVLSADLELGECFFPHHPP